MRHTKLAIAAMALAVLAGCGGTSSEPGDQTVRTKFSAQVSFGDSLSDVGSYKVGLVAQLGGGKFTINGDNTKINEALTGRNWTELVAAQLSLPAPCAAMTGLNGNASQGLNVAVTNHAGCYGYAQGGARVTNPVGPGNALTGSALGALTVPVVTQVANHLAAVGGKFKGDEIVFVMAGGNDVLFQLGQLSAGATTAGGTAFVQALVPLLAAGATNPQTAAAAIGQAAQTAAALPGATPTSIATAAFPVAAAQPGNAGVVARQATIVATATAAATKAGNDYVAAQGPTLVTALKTAGAELAKLVKEQIVAKGANYVAVNNLPDVATTPAGRARSPELQALIDTMVKAFNAELTASLSAESKVVIVDVYSVSHDQATNPGPYGLTNVSEPACNLTAASNPLGTSLTCTGSNLKEGDVSHYSFADDVHPTPFNNLLLARYVSRSLVTKGWL